MAGLTDKAGGSDNHPSDIIDQAQQAWRKSMTRQLDTLRHSIQEQDPQPLALCCGATYETGALCFPYWNQPLRIGWPALEPTLQSDGSPCSTFDTAMILYYLNCADGTPLADRWIGFRDLPNGAFYHQAFQGYSGKPLARALGQQPETFQQAARSLGGWNQSGLAPYAFAFQPFPRIRLAAVLWPGDEDFPPRASILFDAAASHYMVTDGLALLGAGLARRLIRHSPSTDG